MILTKFPEKVVVEYLPGLSKIETNVNIIIKYKWKIKGTVIFV
jgi:hypothetical protein